MASFQLASRCLQHLGNSVTTTSQRLGLNLLVRSKSTAAPISATPPVSPPPLSVTEDCKARLRHLNASADSPKMLRLEVEGGGCSGFQYKFNLDDNVTEGDHVFGSDPLSRVVVDDTSLSLVRGSTLDFHTELIRSAFRVVSNPQSETGCSCGVSFSLKM